MSSRVSFTVMTKDSTCYDANILSITFADHTMEPQLSFVCSGRQMTIAAKDIQSVTYCNLLNHAWCPLCESKLSFLQPPNPPPTITTSNP